MSRVVWKYVLGPYSWLDMPGYVNIRAVGRDPNGAACLWAEVEPGMPLSARRFVVIGTGMAVPAASAYIGTIPSTPEQPRIWHVYELLGGKDA